MILTHTHRERGRRRGRKRGKEDEEKERGEKKEQGGGRQRDNNELSLTDLCDGLERYHLLVTGLKLTLHCA